MFCRLKLEGPVIMIHRVVAHAPCAFRLQDDEEGDAFTSGIDGNDSFAVLSNITTLRQLLY